MDFSNETLAGIGIGAYLVLTFFSAFIEKFTESRKNINSAGQYVSIDEFERLRRRVEQHISDCAIKDTIEQRLRENQHRGN